MNGSWGEWSDWSECDNICGEGNQTRSRQCDSPAPQYGGEDCQGEDQERQECNKESHCGKALDSLVALCMILKILVSSKYFIIIFHILSNVDSGWFI